MHNRGLIFCCTAACQSQKNSHTCTHWISCRHHKPAASLTEFLFPITSSDDLITFPFDAIHENKRTRDGISLLPARFLRSVLAVAFQMADSEMHFAEL